MGKEWDGWESPASFQRWCHAWASECLRVLKPGGWMLAFGGTRTWHRLVCGVEDAGFEIRDGVASLTGQDAPGLMWIHGQGFPKSRDVSKDIDRMAGAEREVVGQRDRYRDGGVRQNRGNVNNWGETATFGTNGVADITAPVTEDAARWEGWGTALKPAWEPIVVARKPLKSTVAANVLEFGTGALNIDACKVAHASEADLLTSLAKNPGRDDTVTSGTYGANRPQQSVDTAGRWPTNVVFTHSAACEPIGLREVRSSVCGPGSSPAGTGDVWSLPDADLGRRGYGTESVEAWACAPDCPVGELDRQSGVGTSLRNVRKPAGGIVGNGQTHGHMQLTEANIGGFNDSGGASRFYPTFKYQAKAPASERPRLEDGTAHETVKPLGFISWAVRLITPPGGTVLDMFGGSGPVAEACIIEGFRCVLIEQDPKSCNLIVNRLSKPIQPAMLTVDDSAQPARPHPVAASRPKPVPEAHPSLFEDLDAAS